MSIQRGRRQRQAARAADAGRGEQEITGARTAARVDEALAARVVEIGNGDRGRTAEHERSRIGDAIDRSQGRAESKGQHPPPVVVRPPTVNVPTVLLDLTRLIPLPVPPSVTAPVVPVPLNVAYVLTFTVPLAVPNTFSAAGFEEVPLNVTAPVTLTLLAMVFPMPFTLTPLVVNICVPPVLLIVLPVEVPATPRVTLPTVWAIFSISRVPPPLIAKVPPVSPNPVALDDCSVPPLIVVPL